MSLSAKIREQLINSFRAELAEHIQTMNDGLLALEQGRVQGQEKQDDMLADVFRAAHSLKGAARAVGVTVIEQLAHSLEDVLDAIRRDAIDTTPELFTACYQAIDAIQTVQETYEAGETTPPMEAVAALADLEPFRPMSRKSREKRRPPSRPKPKAATKKRATAPAPQPEADSGKTDEQEAVLGAALHEQLSNAWQVGDELASAASPAPEQVESEVSGSLFSEDEPPTVDSADRGRTGSTDDAVSAPTSVTGALGANGTIRVSVEKLDALMNQLNELLAAKIRAEQQLNQLRQLQDLVVQWQKEWLVVRGVYNRLARQEKSGLLSAHRLKSIDALRGGALAVAEGSTLRTQFAADTWLGSSVPLETLLADGNDGSQASLLRELGKDVAQLLDYVGASQSQLHDLHDLVNDMSRQYASDTTYMSMVIDDLEQEIKRVRMLPLTTITGPFGRMVRDLAQAAHKEVLLRIVGSDTELDKQVLEQIKDPLVHLLRNAVDHGIESPKRREVVGKPRTGTITLAAEQLGKNILIRVSDDGAGLDFGAIRESIARRGVLDADSLTEADLKEAIFQAGVSTSPIITDISGRGVGLDVVRRNVEALRGTVDVRSVPGKGTTFTLTLPLRLSSSRGLLVRTGGETYAIPLSNIIKIESYLPEEIISLEGQDTIRHDGEPLTLVRLSDVLELPPAASSPSGGTGGEDGILVVIAAAAERRMAFAIEALLGEQEMVIKSLGKQLSRVGGVAGATVLGNRQVVLVLNANDLIKLAMRGKRRSVLDTLVVAESAPAERTQREILVVDDSITTRTLEKNILEAAGYAVRLATDGQEALSDIASAGVPDLIVTDVAMPRMNGFELTRQVKGDEHTGSTPVILVTSLDSDEDKARGIEVGADAYIVKSGFDQDNLLETIEQLI
jgi:two-component system chemotaxis sensor kinase CheA